MEAFLINLFWSILIGQISKVAFGPDPMDGAQAASAGDVDAPTIDEGTSIPVIFGSVLTARQNVSWYGGLGNEPIVKQGVTTGYKYRLTAQCSICMGPVDDIREVRFEDFPTEAAITTAADYWDWDINQPDLFGGTDKEGGVIGVVRIYKGTTTQTPDVELTTLTNAELPAYRRLCYAVLRDTYIGTSPRLKSPSFLVERCPNTLGVTEGLQRIGDHRDANPVCVIYEALTDPVWGAAIPSDQFNLLRWRAAAATVHAEGLGISLTLSSPADVDATVDSLVRYIDAVIYDDPATGLVDIQLVREADLEDAPTLDARHVDAVTISRISWHDLKSTVKVTFTDASRNYETGGVMVQNSAVVRALGGAVDLETVASPGYTNAETATFAATRLLRASSAPLSKVEVRGDRSLAPLRVGQPFRLTWARPYVNAYYRVTQISFGSSSDPWPVINAVEDVFAAASNTFTPPVAGGGGVTGARAQPISRAVLLEMPYYLRRNDNRSLIYGAARPNASHTGFKVADDDTLYGWMASAPLTTSIPQWDGPTLANLTLAVALPDDVDTPSPAEIDAGEALLLVGTELMSYSGVTRGTSSATFTGLTRGVLDTVPVAHAAGELAVVLATCRVRQARDLASDGAVSISARTFTAADAQTAEEATVTTITTASRAARPLPPGALAVNGTLWATGPHSNNPTVSWEPRTRATTAIISQAATGYTAEAGTDYVLRVYSGGVLLATYTPTGTSQSIAETGSLVLTLHARRGGLESFQGQRLACTVNPAVYHLLTETGHKVLLETGDKLLLDA